MNRFTFTTLNHWASVFKMVKRAAKIISMEWENEKRFNIIYCCWKAEFNVSHPHKEYQHKAWLLFKQIHFKVISVGYFSTQTEFLVLSNTWKPISVCLHNGRTNFNGIRYIIKQNLYGKVDYFELWSELFVHLQISSGRLCGNESKCPSKWQQLCFE